MATSADRKPSECVLGIAVIWGLIGCSDVVAAGDEQPDLEFLEYLGSWEESDEDWLLFDGPESEPVATDGKKRIDAAPEGEVSTESDGES